MRGAGATRTPGLDTAAGRALEQATLGGRVRRLLGVRAGEEPPVFLTFLLVATVIASYVLARTIRNGLFLSQFDAHRLVYVYVAVPLLLVAFAPIYTAIVGRAGQRTVIIGTLGFFVANVLAFWVLFRRAPEPWLAALFYVWVNCYGVIASFQAWSFATSLFDTRQAKRLFGLIGSGAPAGAVVGGLLARTLVVPLGGSVNLLLVLALLLVVAILLVNLTLRVIPRRTPNRVEWRVVDLLPQTLGLVWRTGYLRGIAALVVLVAVVTQWSQFQLLLVAQERFSRDADRLTAFLGEWNVYLGLVAFLVQVLLTGPGAAPLRHRLHHPAAALRPRPGLRPRPPVSRLLVGARHQLPRPEPALLRGQGHLRAALSAPPRLGAVGGEGHPRHRLQPGRGRRGRDRSSASPPRASPSASSPCREPGSACVGSRASTS